MRNLDAFLCAFIGVLLALVFVSRCASFQSPPRSLTRTSSSSHVARDIAFVK